MQVGGRRYGEGFKGVTMDAPCLPNDAETACAEIRSVIELNDDDDDGDLEVTVYGLGKRTTEKTYKGRPAQDVARALIRALDRSYIVKCFKPRANKNFFIEIETMRVLERVYGPKKVRDMTTIKPVPLRGMSVCAVHMSYRGAPRKDLKMVFSVRCERTADAVVYDDETCIRLITDVTSSMSVLHRAGMIHGDVKLDNMVQCSGGVFKLIDWEMALDATERGVKRGFVRGTLLRNYASPLAWRLWGLSSGHNSTAAFLLYYAFKQTAWFVKARGALITDIARVAMAYDRFVMQRDDVSPSRLYDEYVYSFDLFNLGFILLAIARDRSGTLSRLTPRVKSFVIDVSRRMTEYDHPEFFRSAHDAELYVRRNAATSA
jgi:serine/threonine protein kinase